MSTLRVVDAGLLTLVQDGGRGAVAHLGLGRGGAVDQAALAAANTAVGNPAAAAALETLLDGLTLVATAACMVAVSATGAPVVPRELKPGDALTVRGGDDGFRRYVAVRGGVDAPANSHVDTHDTIGVAGLDTTFPVTTDDPPLRGDVRVHPGPQHDWFAFDELFARAWTVNTTSDRTGVRLEADTPLTRVHDAELQPQGIIPGAIQVPPSGQPIVFLYDHPVTGGYPVVGVVDPADLRLVAQTRPGRVRPFSAHAR